MTWQIKQGLNADRTGYTPALGECIFATDTKRLWVGDGSTAGGVDPFATDPYGDVYNVKLYGATGDGVTDDTAAIQAAVDAAKAAGGGTVTFPPAVYATTAAIEAAHTDTDQQLCISAYGATIQLGSGLADTCLKIGAASTTAVNVVVNGGTWGCVSRDWTGTTAISLYSASRCALRDVIAANCEYGIVLHGADARGSAYNTVMPLRIVDCLHGITCSADTDGWANSNHFFGGAIQYTSAVDAVDCSAGWAINVATPTDGDHILNDNHFYGQTLEIASTHSAAKPGAVRVFGEQNSFNGLRIERFTAPYYVGITGTIAAGAYYAQRNRIFTGYQTDHNFTGTIKDDTANERLAFDLFGAQETVLYGGSATYPILGLRASSTGYKAFEVYNNGGTTRTFGVDSDGSVDCVGLTSAGNIETTGGTHVTCTNLYATKVVLAGATQILTYAGSPEAAATAPVGSLCCDITNGKLYVKATGTGNTGWVVAGTQT